MAAGNEVLRAHLARRAQAQPAAVAPLPAGPPAPARLAAIAAAQAARAVAGLALTCADSRDSIASLAELPEHLPDQALLAIIEGGIGHGSDGADRLGVVALSPGMAAALIEMQTLGRLTATPPEARRPTRADAALAADFIDAMLAGLGGGDGSGAGPAGALAGFRYASHLADPRPLGLMLEDRGFRILRLHLHLGPLGEREGQILLALPLPADAPRLPAPAPPPVALAATGAEAAPLPPASPPPPAPSRPTLARAMQSAPITLHAILCRRRITLAELRALAPGVLLALPRQALTEARLESASGHRLALGKLGEVDGFHALRLLAPQSAGQTARVSPVEEPPIGDLAQPDAFRSEAGGTDSGAHKWHEALVEGTPGG